MKNAKIVVVFKKNINIDINIGSQLDEDARIELDENYEVVGH